MGERVAKEDYFMLKVRSLVECLVSKRDFVDVGNFYAGSSVKQLNLEKYFRALFQRKPKWMLVGEAPGIHGCVKTGIPFTSEQIIQDGRTYCHFPDISFVVEGNSGETTANVIWEKISKLADPPVMWNVFPLHPMNGERNRPPTAKEIEWGIRVLQNVLALFPEARVVTVGRKAEAACERFGIETVGHLFHPPRPIHATHFRSGFDSILLSDS